MNSSVVVAGNQINAADINNLRLDLLRNASDFLTTTGSGSAYEVQVQDQLAGGDITAGFVVRAYMHVANTGACTILVKDSGGTLLTAKNVLLRNGNTPAPGDFPINSYCEFVYNGTNFIYKDVESSFIKVFTYGGTITAGDAVYMKNSDGKVYRTTTGGDEGTYSFIGFAITSGVANDLKAVQVGGIISGLSSLTIGTRYYLNGTAGQISATPASREFAVGIALSATTLLIQRSILTYSDGVASSNGTTGTTTTTITTGFRPRKITAFAVNNGSKVVSHGQWSNGNHHCAYRSVSVTDGTELFDTTKLCRSYDTFTTVGHTFAISNVTDTGFDLVDVATNNATQHLLYFIVEG